MQKEDKARIQQKLERSSRKEEKIHEQGRIR